RRAQRAPAAVAQLHIAGRRLDLVVPAPGAHRVPPRRAPPGHPRGARAHRRRSGEVLEPSLRRALRARALERARARRIRAAVDAGVDVIDELGRLRALRRRRRRLAAACFFVAGVGFGTLLYLLRAHAQLLRAAPKQALALGIVTLTVLSFWLGARAEAELAQIDEQIREREKRQ